MPSRKQFLIASSAAAAAAPSALRAATATAAPAEAAPFVFDRARFDAIVSRDVKHRHSYASVGLADGLVLNAMNNALDAYESLGERPPSVTSAAVLYHNIGIFLGFDDDVWNRIVIPAVPKMPSLAELSKLKPGDGNPWLHSKGGARDTSIETLTKRGATFMVCNNATNGFASELAGVLSSTHDAVYAKLAAGLNPSALLVPAGVWAIHALQEAHFTYQQVDL